MSFTAWMILILVATNAGAAGIAALGWKRAKKQRIRADKAELNLNAVQADNRRKNAALETMADNMEKLRNEKARIAKSDLDGLISHARELSDLVPSEHAGSGSGDDGSDPDSAAGTLSGSLTD